MSQARLYIMPEPWQNFAPNFGSTFCAYAMEKKIIHLNIADFSTAVERLLDRTLLAKPLIVAQQNARAAVLDMSEEAYGDGVRKGMLLNKARRLCRQATVLPPQPAKYQQVLQQCFDHAKYFSPLVEYGMTGTGHIYIDATGTHRLFGPAPDVAWKLRRTLRQELQLDPIWSVAPNKMVAKVASRLVKPTGEYIVASGDEETFLSPLPVTIIPGIHPTDIINFNSLHIRKINQVKALSIHELSIVCGSRAYYVYNAVRGIDYEPVTSPDKYKIPADFHHFFSPDTNREQVIRAAVASLAARAGFTLRADNFGCRKIAIKIIYTDGISVTRQAANKLPAADDPTLEQLALAALYRGWHRRVRVRQVTLTCSKRGTLAHQLLLFDDRPEKRLKNKKINNACDVLHEKYGAGLIKRGIHFRNNNVTPLATQ